MPQHTKCGNVTNKGNTCVNPEIKYGSVEGGIPLDYQSNSYKRWCDQLGGSYDTHTSGFRTGYCVFMSKSYDDNVWHWADCGDGFWYNKTLDFYEGRNDYITSITCEKSNGKLLHSSNISDIIFKRKIL